MEGKWKKLSQEERTRSKLLFNEKKRLMSENLE